MDDRTQRLITLMQENQLSSKDVARIIKRSPQTVRIWRSSDRRTIPEAVIDLLELRVARVL